MLTLGSIRRTSSLRFFLLLPVAIISISGCAPATASRSLSPAVGVESPARITVFNQHLADIGVYVVVNGTRYKLGAVESFQSRTFRIPRVIQLPAEMDLFVSALATAQQFQSASITLKSGDEVVLSVENSVQFSSIRRR